MQVQFEVRNEVSNRHVVSPSEISVTGESIGAQRMVTAVHSGSLVKSLWHSLDVSWDQVVSSARIPAEQWTYHGTQVTDGR